jgi:hypothetical protein
VKYYCLITSPDGGGWDSAAVVVDVSKIERDYNYRAAFLGAAAFVEGLVSMRARYQPQLFLDAESLPEELRCDQDAWDGWAPWPLDEEQEKSLTERPVGYSVLVVSEQGWAFEVVEKHSENTYNTNRFNWAEKPAIG